MSRIGKAPVVIPSGVTVTVSKENVVTVKGPKGELKETVDRDMSSTATLSFTLFIGAAMGGFYLLDLFKTLISLFELLLLREKVVIDFSKMNTSSTLSEEARKLLKASFLRSLS